MEHAEGVLAAAAARRHGLFTGDDVARAGVSPGRLRRLIEIGWCERLHPAVFRIRGAPRSFEQRLLGAVLASGPGAVASHRAAARLWSIPGYANATPEVTRPHGLGQRRGLAVIHGSCWLPPAHHTIRHEIPVTTPARTAFDLAGVVSPKRLERDVDDLLHRGVVTVRQIEQAFFALARRGRRGTVAMRERIEAIGGEYVAPASELERRARELFAAHGVEAPRFEVHLGDGDWIGRVDCLWARQKVIVELDGRRYHGGLIARDADRRRDNALMAAGWRVLRITWDDLVDRPDEVLAWLRTALAVAV